MKLYKTRFRIGCLRHIADCRKVLAIAKRIMLRWGEFGMVPDSSAMHIVVSIAREAVRTQSSSRRLPPSIARESADRKPATGAFTPSFLLPMRRITQSTSLYAMLKHIRNRPNLPESIKAETLRLHITSHKNLIKQLAQLTSF